MKKTLLLLFLLPALLHAQGGMWLPMLLEKQNEKEMKALGLKLEADDLYAPNRPSIKDAICLFGSGCTGEMISPQGLLLTNHHCGLDAIQRHSTVEHNYVKDGFWAMSRPDELPCPGLKATFISRMEDVTALALKDVTEAMNEKDRLGQIDKNLAQIRVNTKKEAWEEVSVKPFYKGNQYFLFVTAVYTDVRLVGAPPESIGKFGADTDNWEWPRHTGDFSLFRVYADKDNRPAPFAAGNQPFKPAHFLPVSLEGVAEGDFTMVYGFPGTTDEYLPASALQQTAEIVNPARVDIRDKSLKIMDNFMRNDPAIKVGYVARYARIANSWKKWLGEMQGLKTCRAVPKRQEHEAEFMRRINQNPDWKIRYTNLLPRLNQTYQDMQPYAEARELYNETFSVNIQATNFAAKLNDWAKTYDANNLPPFSAKVKEMDLKADSMFRGYSRALDQAVFAVLIERFAKTMRPEWGGSFAQTEAERHGGFTKLAEHLYANSVLTNPDRWKAAATGDVSAFGQTLQNDPLLVFWRTVYAPYAQTVAPKVQELQNNINLLQRLYMAAQMQVFKDKRFFPDANSTLRLTYGKVDGFSPRDALRYEYRTNLDGVMEKYVPGDYEFDVPQKLIDLWKNKDYGQYAAKDGRLPVAFLGTNHTTGGNSGSPALDARGNLVGLNFDRVWEGTMSDLNYDPAICRNIMVDTRYILFIIDKFAGAGYLLEEMKLMKGKRK
ncbi:MAG: S46 family peptidase [Saprospiraceae bacterium]